MTVTTRWEPETLAAQFGVTLPDPKGVSTLPDKPGVSATRVAGRSSYATKPVDLEQHPRVKAAIDTNTGDRSADTMRIVGTVADDYLELAHARWAVQQRTDLTDRLDGRKDDDVLVCWLKVVDERQRRIGNTTIEDPSAADNAGTDASAEDLPAPVDSRAKIWKAGDLKPAAAPRWLAKRRIPRAAVTVVIGDEGIGKSLFWVWVIAAVTTGEALPAYGIPARDPGVVMIVVTEDDWTTEVLPRLQVAGADLSMVRVICAEDDGSGAPMFPRDNDRIRDWDEDISLIVVDAWLDTVAHGLQVRDTQQARQALHPWKEIATAKNTSVMLLTHTNRVSSGNSRERVGATGALRQTARMLLWAQEDEEGRLTIGPEKANGVALVNAAMFAIESAQHFEPTDDHDGTVPRLVYNDDADRTARQILEDVHKRSQQKADKPDNEVTEWLHEVLADGTQWAACLYGAAEQKGWSERQLKYAKRKLGIQSKRDSKICAWFWFPPDQGDTKRVQPPMYPCTFVPLHSCSFRANPSDQPRGQGDKEYIHIDFSAPTHTPEGIPANAEKGTNPVSPCVSPSVSPCDGPSAEIEHPSTHCTDCTDRLRTPQQMERGTCDECHAAGPIDYSQIDF